MDKDWFLLHKSLKNNDGKNLYVKLVFPKSNTGLVSKCLSTRQFQWHMSARKHEGQSQFNTSGKEAFDIAFAALRKF
jgi:hypothetical protein